MPTLVSDSLLEVHPFEQAEVSWDNAFVPSLDDEKALGFKRGELKTLFLAGRQSGKSMLTADLIEGELKRLKDVPTDE